MLPNTFYERSDPKYKHLIGKQIELMYKKKKWVGIARFIGINDFHKQFQVTLDRTPLWPVDPSTIKERKVG